MKFSDGEMVTGDKLNFFLNELDENKVTMASRRRQSTTQSRDLGYSSWEMIVKSMVNLWQMQVSKPHSQVMNYTERNDRQPSPTIKLPILGESLCNCS